MSEHRPAALLVQLRAQMFDAGFESRRALPSLGASLLFLGKPLVRDRQRDAVGDLTRSCYVRVGIGIAGRRAEHESAEHPAAQANPDPHVRAQSSCRHEFAEQRLSVDLERFRVAAANGTQMRCDGPPVGLEHRTVDDERVLFDREPQRYGQRHIAGRIGEIARQCDHPHALLVLAQEAQHQEVMGDDAARLG